MSFSKNILHKMMCWEVLHIHFKSYQTAEQGKNILLLLGFHRRHLGACYRILLKIRSEVSAIYFQGN